MESASATPQHRCYGTVTVARAAASGARPHGEPGSLGTLLVNTASSTWAFELGRLAETILAQLREQLGKAAPRALKFAAGPLPEPPAEAAERHAAAGRESSPEHRAEAAEITAGIEDDELRRLVARAAASLSKGADQSADSPPDDRGF